MSYEPTPPPPYDKIDFSASADCPPPYVFDKAHDFKLQQIIRSLKILPSSYAKEFLYDVFFRVGSQWNFTIPFALSRFETPFLSFSSLIEINLFFKTPIAATEFARLSSVYQYTETRQYNIFVLKSVPHQNKITIKFTKVESSHDFDDSYFGNVS